METNSNDTEAKQPASAGCHPTTCSPSSMLPIGKTFTLIGYGRTALVKRTKDEGLILWSICNYSGDGDEFTRGWSGCDPKQLYFLENKEL
jgi:hypothetical protein